MADWVNSLNPIAKRVILIGSCVVSTTVAYLLYKRFYFYSEDVHDEGFEDVPVTEGREKRVLMLGLDGAGKTSILAALGKQKQPVQVNPTEGFYIIYVETRGMSLNIWEIGGAPHMRTYWRNFTQDTCVLLFVVDAACPKRFAESRNELEKILQEKLLQGVDVVIIANKQDKPGAKSASEVQLAMGMQDTCTIETQVPSSGQRKGIDALQQMLSSKSS